MANQQKGKNTKKVASKETQDKTATNEENIIEIQAKDETNDKSNIKVEAQSEKETAATVVEDKKSVKPETLKAKEASGDASASNQKRSSAFGFMWPIITGAIAAGGVIASQNMWLKDAAPQADAIESNMAEVTQSLNDHQQNIDQLNVDLDALKQQAEKNAGATYEKDIADLQQGLKDQISQIQTLKETIDNQQTSYDALTRQYQQLQTAWQDLNSQYGKINAQVEGTISQIQALSESLDDGTTPEIQGQLAALETSRRQSVQALQAQIANLTKALNDVQSQQPAFEIFDKRVNQLESNVTDLQSSVDGINQKVDQDIQQLSDNMQQAASVNNLLVQFDALEQAVLSGNPYDTALSKFKEQSGDNAGEEALLVLEQNQQGIARFSLLKSRFNDLARSLVITARKADAAASDSKTKSLLSSFNELVTVTRNDGGEQGSIDRLIYDVKIALDAEDLEQVQTLFGSAQAEVQMEANNWLQDVKNRQDTLNALQKLKLQLLGSV